MNTSTLQFPCNVFVYGTLRRGMYNHRVMERANGKFLDTGVIQATMVNLGAFPAVILGDGLVKGEVFEIPDIDGMRRLDSLEGYPSFYQRDQVIVDLDNHESMLAWVYHMADAQGKIVESGDWVNRKVAEL